MAIIMVIMVITMVIMVIITVIMVIIMVSMVIIMVIMVISKVIMVIISVIMALSNEPEETRHEADAEALARGLARPMPSLESFLRRRCSTVG